MFGVAMINKLHKDRNWQSLVLLILAFGASGGAILGMVFYGESSDWKRLVFIGMVLGAAVGLKLDNRIFLLILSRQFLNEVSVCFLVHGNI